MEILKLKDSFIRNRGDDVSIRTYVNRRYPVIKCCDPYHDVDYGIRIIMSDNCGKEKIEETHVLKH